MKILKDIKPLSDYPLQCLFSEGSIRIADIKPFLDKEAFKPLNDPQVFSIALYNGGYFVEWENYHEGPPDQTGRNYSAHHP